MLGGCGAEGPRFCGAAGPSGHRRALRLLSEKRRLRPRRANKRCRPRGFPCETRAGLILTGERGGFF